jgi:hypothetical protein
MSEWQEQKSVLLFGEATTLFQPMSDVIGEDAIDGRQARFEQALPRLFERALPRLFERALARLFERALPRLFERALARLFERTLTRLFLH